MNARVEAFFDPATFTYSYVVSDPETRQCALIDSVLDYDPASGRTSHAGAECLVDFVREHDLKVQWLLETHVHADHLSAAPYLKQRLGGTLAIGDQITVVQNTFGSLFNAGSEFATDGRQFDRLFHDGDVFQVGHIQARAIHTPGHTPACMTYVIGDAAFVGDTLFMPDYGTARCDFPGGSSETLFNSIQKILALPDETRIFVGHDYKAPGRDEYAWETTVGEQKALNIHIGQGKSIEDFVSMRDARDATLGMPRLILPSLQVNMRAGQMPEPDDQGDVFLKIPVNKI